MSVNHTQVQELEYNYITDGIYIGTNQCCQTHFDEKLKKEGIIADISLEEDRLDAPFGVDFYVWIPVKNHAAPKPDQLEFGVSVLEKLVLMKKKVYVHCKNGHGRAPTLAAAYLIIKGKSPEEAEAFIKSKRPSMHLQKIQKTVLQKFSQKNKWNFHLSSRHL
ncbi:dual specificity protein phosphatase family protein [Candidatus Giovannonibacteria bacterium]|nr:dual specificity protein phosphatase family protein [Candidatus Giovannonibacteria bacterium]